MSMSDTVRAAMVAALKAGDKERKGTLSLLLQALEKRQKDKLGQALTEVEEAEVVTKMAKQTRESIDTCPGDRTELLQKLRAEASVIAEFQPKQMSEAEIRLAIEDVLSGLGLASGPTARDKGTVMKMLMPVVKGKADGKVVNEILMSYFV